MKTNSLKQKISSVLFGLAALALVPLSGHAAEPDSAHAASAAPAVVAPSVAALPDFSELVDRTGNAVVNIRTTEKATIDDDDDEEDKEMQEFFQRFFGMPMPRQGQPDHPGAKKHQYQEEVPRGVGSGFIISPDGYVMTNAHVVDGADDVYVTLTDKREFKAKIIGSDERTDVALVKIPGGNLPYLKIGDSNKIRVGEWVIAIGSPFGLDNTVTAGIISAKARDTGEYLPLIQTDVAVNPGNSGGPLINMRGEVIGINSQIYSRSGGYMGISFAVPIDEAMRVADQLRKTGKVIRGRIGVQIGEVTKDVADSLGLVRAEGALVQRVEPDGPAAKAGVQPGDVILKFNGVPIDHATDLPRVVGGTKPGTRSTMTVWRKGALRELTLTIAELEPSDDASPAKQKPKVQTPDMLGLVVSDLTKSQLKDMDIEGGVEVVAVQGSAALSGIRAGDVLLRLNNTDIKDAAQFHALVSKLDKKKPALLLVRRGDTSQFVVVKTDIEGQ